MALKITHQHDTAAGTAPAAGDLLVGELAINAADAEIYTKDTSGNVRKFQNTTTGTAANVLYTCPNGVAQTVQSRLEQYISVKDFGATGDGQNDDTAAVRLAFDRVKDGEGGTVYFPAGTYLISEKLEYLGTSTKQIDIAVRGESRSNTILKYNAPDTVGRMFKITEAVNCTFSDLTFDFNHAVDDFGGSIEIRGCPNAEVSNCAFLDLDPLMVDDITIGTGDGTTTEFIYPADGVTLPFKDYQIMPGTVTVTAGSVALDDAELADGHLFLTNPTLNDSGQIAPNQTTQGQILYGNNNGRYSVRVKFQTAPSASVPVTLKFGYADQRQPILVLNCTDVLVTNNILKCLGRIKVGRPGNRVVITSNIINGCNDNAITVVNINPTGETDSNNQVVDPATVSPQYKLITSEMIISDNNVAHAGTNAIFWGGDGGGKVPYPLEYHNIQVTNNNIVCSGGSAMKFVPSDGLNRSGRITIANNNIEMQFITKDDNSVVKIRDPKQFSYGVNFASSFANDIVFSNNNMDSRGATVAAIQYSKLRDCVFTGNRINGPTQRTFRGNGVSLIENCVFNNNLFTCSTVISPSQGSSVVKDTTFEGNVVITDNTIRKAGALINGGKLENVVISNNLFKFPNIEFGDYVVGETYVITEVGNTPWNDIGATAATSAPLFAVGDIFVATKTGSAEIGTTGKGGPGTSSTPLSAVMVDANASFGAFVIGQNYEITKVGDTVWTAIGGPASPTLGDTFTATADADTPAGSTLTGLSQTGTTGTADKVSIESSFQVTNNNFVGSLYWNPDIVRTAGVVGFATGSTKFPNSGPLVPTFKIPTTVAFGSFVSGALYVITSVGNTTWDTIGGPQNSAASVGDAFIASGDGAALAGSTGTAAKPDHL